MNVEAVYSGGAFRPLEAVALAENQRVRLTIEPLPLPPHVAEWLARTAAHREALFAKYGYFSDSTELVAAERRRNG